MSFSSPQNPDSRRDGETYPTRAEVLGPEGGALAYFRPVDVRPLDVISYFRYIKADGITPLST